MRSSDFRLCLIVLVSFVSGYFFFGWLDAHGWLPKYREISSVGTGANPAAKVIDPDTKQKIDMVLELKESQIVDFDALPYIVLGEPTDLGVTIGRMDGKRVELRYDGSNLAPLGRLYEYGTREWAEAAYSAMTENTIAYNK